MAIKLSHAKTHYVFHAFWFIMLTVLVVLEILIYTQTKDDTEADEASNKSQQNIPDEMDKHLIEFTRHLPFDYEEFDQYLAPLMFETYQQLPRPLYPHPKESFSLISSEESNIDPIKAIIYINMKGNPERNQLMLDMLKSFRVPVYRIEGIRDSRKGVGILKSHMSAMRFAQQYDGDVMIMEDDFQLDVDMVALQYALKMVYERYPNFDCFLLSPVVFMWSYITRNQKIDYDVMRILKATTMSAYVVQKHYLPIFLDHYQNTLHTWSKSSFRLSDYNDQTWFTLQQKDQFICWKRPLGYQREGHTTYNDYANNKCKWSEDRKKMKLGEKPWHEIFLTQSFEWDYDTLKKRKA